MNEISAQKANNKKGEKHMGTKLNGSYIYVRNELHVERVFDLSTKLWIIEDLDTDVRKKFRFDEMQQTSTDDLIGYDVDLTCLIDLTNYSYNSKKESFNPSNQNKKLQITVIDPDPQFHKKIRENMRVIVKSEDVIKNSVVGQYNPDFYVRTEKLSFLKTDKDALTNQFNSMKNKVIETQETIDGNSSLDSHVKSRLKERLKKNLEKTQHIMNSLAQ